jgi:hypothetical protein
MASSGHAIEVVPVAYRVLTSNRTFVRNTSDRRYSVWTDSEDRIPAILQSLGITDIGNLSLKAGEIFAIFLNDQITEDLVQVARNSATKQYFADYADSGIMFKLRPLSGDKKYSHLTIVIFSVTDSPSHLGMRGMISNGLSEKK